MRKEDSKMQKFISFHGMGFDFDEPNTFGPWLTQYVKKFGPVHHCKFPLDRLTYKDWEQTAKDDNNCVIDEKTIIIAHSLGTLFLPKFLHKYGLKPKAVVCIAGGYTSLFCHHKELGSFAPTKEDFLYVRENVDNRYFVYSSPDRFFSEDMQKEYAGLMGAESMFLSGYGHFGRTEGVTKIPELEGLIEQIVKNGKN